MLFYPLLRICVFFCIFYKFFIKSVDIAESLCYNTVSERFYFKF